MLSYLYTFLRNADWLIQSFNLPLRPDAANLNFNDSEYNGYTITVIGKELHFEWHGCGNREVKHTESYDLPIVSVSPGRYAVRIILDDGSYRFRVKPELSDIDEDYPITLESQITDQRTLLWEAEDVQEELKDLPLHHRIDAAYLQLGKKLDQLEANYQTYLQRPLDPKERDDATIELLHTDQETAVLVMTDDQVHELMNHLREKLTDSVNGMVRIKIGKHYD